MYLITSYKAIISGLVKKKSNDTWILRNKISVFETHFFPSPAAAAAAVVSVTQHKEPKRFSAGTLTYA